MAEQTVELEPGQSRVVSFEVTPTVAKTYSVSVDGLGGSFEAVALEFATADMTALGYSPPDPNPVHLAGVKVEIIGVGYCITKYGYGGNWEQVWGSPGCFIENVPPGTHDVLMSLSGYKTTTRQVTFKPLEIRTFFFRLYKD